jgi:hypothetical protein
MRVFGITLFLASLRQGILAQQEFLEKLPSCAVGLLWRHHYQLLLTSWLVKMRHSNSTQVDLLSQRV